MTARSFRQRSQAIEPADNAIGDIEMAADAMNPVVSSHQLLFRLCRAASDRVICWFNAPAAPVPAPRTRDSAFLAPDATVPGPKLHSQGPGGRRIATWHRSQCGSGPPCVSAIGKIQEKLVDNVMTATKLEKVGAPRPHE